MAIGLGIGAVEATAARADTVSGGANGYEVTFTFDNGSNGEIVAKVSDTNEQHVNNAQTFLDLTYTYYDDTGGTGAGHPNQDQPMGSWPEPSTQETNVVNGLNPNPGVCYNLSETLWTGTNTSSNFASANPVEMGQGSGTICNDYNGSGSTTTSQPGSSTTTTTTTQPGGTSGVPNPILPAVGITASLSGQGFWTDSGTGGVTAFNGASNYGSMAGKTLNKGLVAMASTADGRGYYLLGGDGGIFTFGDAAFYGSTGGMKLNQPLNGLAVTPDGLGYWLVASDGGIFTFGDAPFRGSMGAIRLNKPVVGMVSYGGAYTLVASDGGVFNFGTPFYGSLGGKKLAAPIVGIAPTPDGHGYWMVASDGGVFTFGDAAFYGSASESGQPITGITPTPDGKGYWLAEGTGGVLSYGDSAAATASSG